MALSASRPRCAPSDSGPYGFKVYHYDSTGNREVVIHQSALCYPDRDDAMNAASDWLDEQGLDAEFYG